MNGLRFHLLRADYDVTNSGPYIGHPQREGLKKYLRAMPEPSYAVALRNSITAAGGRLPVGTQCRVDRQMEGLIGGIHMNLTVRT